LLVVEHNTRVVQQIADEVLFLHQGHLMARGTPQEIISRSRAGGNLFRRRDLMVAAIVRITAGYGAKTVISDVSFALEPGQILAFLGHNGAGKTTTLRR
jgi:ABC-type multidrug transport system ATPase subunit